MDTASIQFVLFGLAAALLSNFSPSPAWRSAVLMLASIVFLGLLNQKPLAFIPLIGFLAMGYGGLLLLNRGQGRHLAWILIAVVVAYAWLKKYTLIPPATFIDFPYFTLGLSYIFFRVLHLLIESADSEEIRRIGLGSYLLYTLNFTTLVSGPIQRYNAFANDQFANEPIELGPGIIAAQIERIIVGFFKVNVLASVLMTVNQEAFSNLTQSLLPSEKLLAALLLAVSYPFFLYANFSGYIDIVIALARLMRVRLPENFDRPFSACSFLDFWNRWHITLSTWLKTYVFNPLLVAMMRRVSSLTLQPFLAVISFFVTFFLVGIWHGRTSEFVVFGVLQGGGVAVNKLWQLGLASVIGGSAYKKLAKNPIYMSFGRGLTFTWFAFTLFWFWANWAQIGKIFTALGALEWIGLWLVIWLLATAVLALWELARGALLSLQIPDGPLLTSRYAHVVYATALGVASLAMTVLLNQPAQVIVYKAF